MSLRGKIIALFFTLAVGPLLAVALYAYLHSGLVLRRIVSESLDAHAAAVAWELMGAIEGLDQTLAKVAASPGVIELLSRGEGADEAGARELDVPGIEIAAGDALRLVALEVRDGSGRTLYQDATRLRPICPPDSRPVAYELAQPVVAYRGSRPIGSVVAHVAPTAPVEPSAALTALASGRTTVLHRGSGLAVSPSGCSLPRDVAEAAGAGAVTAGAAPAGSGRFGYEIGGASRMASLVDLPRSGWTVVSSTDAEALTAPLGRMGSGYVLFVLLIAAATSAAFSVLTGRLTRSLEEVADAARRIGEGDLTPWLPPGTNDEAGRLSLAVGRMADRLRTLIGEVERSGRLAAVGEMASHLAHEVRNPLSSIKLNLQSLRREMGAGVVPDDAVEVIDTSLTEVQRLERVVTGVLSLGQAGRATTSRSSLHGLVEEVFSFLDGQLSRRGIRADLDLAAEHDIVDADHAQLKGVLLNLILNAADSMPEGGHIRAWTRVVERVPGSPAVALHLADTGTGIPPEFRSRIFEPFFTTKTEGSGLGLALALKTIRRHGGALYLERRSELESGTEFVIELPLIGAPAPTVSHWPALSDTSHGTERDEILAVVAGGGSPGEA